MLLKDQEVMLLKYRRSFCQIQFGDHFINCCPKQQSYFFCAPIGHRQERGLSRAGSLQQF
jgi:formate-dependent phosphoribosylglycinamide formyltransferase (GAR transformylase)